MGNTKNTTVSVYLLPDRFISEYGGPTLDLLPHNREGEIGAEIVDKYRDTN